VQRSKNFAVKSHSCVKVEPSVPCRRVKAIAVNLIALRRRAMASAVKLSVAKLNAERVNVARVIVQRRRLAVKVIANATDHGHVCLLDCRTNVNRLSPRKRAFSCANFIKGTVARFVSTAPQRQTRLFHIHCSIALQGGDQIVRFSSEA